MNLTKYILRLFLLFTAVVLHFSVTSRDTLFLKKNSFSIKVGNAMFLAKQETFHYRNVRQGFDDVQYDFMIKNQNTYFNPKISLGYKRVFWKKKTKNLAINYLSFSFDVGLYSIEYINTRVGSYYGGYLWYAFEGEIYDQNTFRFFSIKPGFSYSHRNVNGLVTGFNIGILTSYNYSSSHYGWRRNDIAGTYTEEHGKSNLKARKNLGFQWFGLNSPSISFSIGKVFGNKIELGTYIEADFSLKKEFELYNISFFKNFNNIAYGIYFNY